MIFLKQIFFTKENRKKNRKKLMSKNQFYKVLVLAQKNFDPPLVVIPPNFCHVQVLFFEMSSCKGDLTRNSSVIFLSRARACNKH